MGGRPTAGCLLGIVFGFICLSNNFGTGISATDNDVGNVARRMAKLITIKIPDFDSYCYRDVKKKMVTCDPLVYVKRGPVCIQKCASYKDKLHWCGFTGCSPGPFKCAHVKYKQFGSIVYWVVHWVNPLLPKFYNWWPIPGSAKPRRTAGAGGPLHLSPSLSSNPLLPSIIRKTYAKRSLIAAAIAAHGTYHDAPLHDYLAQFPLTFHAMERAGSVAYGAWQFKGITINIGIIAKMDPTGTMDVILAWAHRYCSKLSGGVIVGNVSTPKPAASGASASLPAGAAAVAKESLSAACKLCDRTADQCVKATKCDASTKYECEPVYEEDYAICQKADAQGNSRSGFCMSRQCSTSLTDSHITEQHSHKLWLPSGYQPPAPVNAVVPAKDLSFVLAALQYWEESARAMLSCTVDNGGCGTDICVADVSSKSMACLDPKAYGYKAAPPGISLTGTPLASLPDIKPQACLQKCTKTKDCNYAIVTLDMSCSLLKEEGTVQVSEFGQVYKRLDFL